MYQTIKIKQKYKCTRQLKLIEIQMYQTIKIKQKYKCTRQLKLNRNTNVLDN